MADRPETIICSTCGAENEAGTRNCVRCHNDPGAPTANRPVVNRDDSGAAAPAPSGEEAAARSEADADPGDRGVVRCEFNDCGNDIGPDETRCDQCGAPRPDLANDNTGRWQVRMDGHRLELVPGESALIGRALESGLAGPLATFMDVSREHLRLSVSRAGDQLQIEDLHTKNGTEINGARLARGTAETVDGEVEVVLGGQVSLKVGPA